LTITFCGTGNPYREFLYVGDVADTCVFVMNNVDFPDLRSLSSVPSTLRSASPAEALAKAGALSPKPNNEIKNTHINIRTGKDLTINDLAIIIKKIIGFKGQLSWDSSKPDGTYRKLLDVSKINRLGWKEKIELKDGVKLVYHKYLA